MLIQYTIYDCLIYMLFDWLNTMKLFYILYFTDTYKHMNNAGSEESFLTFILFLFYYLAKLAL